MTKPLGDADIHKNVASWLTAGNGTDWPSCQPEVAETAPFPRHPRWRSCRTDQNPLSLVLCPRSARLDRRAQPPAPNYNPHNARGTT